MTLPSNIERCPEPECCCKCKLAFVLKGFSALMDKPQNYHYACAVFDDEGIIVPMGDHHGLCEMFTKED